MPTSLSKYSSSFHSLWPRMVAKAYMDLPQKVLKMEITPLPPLLGNSHDTIFGSFSCLSKCSLTVRNKKSSLRPGSMFLLNPILVLPSLFITGCFSYLTHCCTKNTWPKQLKGRALSGSQFQGIQSITAKKCDNRADFGGRKALVKAGKLEEAGNIWVTLKHHEPLVKLFSSKKMQWIWCSSLSDSAQSVMEDYCLPAG